MFFFMVWLMCVCLFFLNKASCALPYSLRWKKGSNFTAQTQQIHRILISFSTVAYKMIWKVKVQNFTQLSEPPNLGKYPEEWKKITTVQFRRGEEINS